MPQSLSKLYVHLAFSTKHREPLLLAPLRAQMHAYLATVLKNQDSPAVEVGGTSDHVHALFRLSKNRSLAAIVEEVKTGSSKWAKTQGRAFVNFYWQSGYGGFSVSPGGCGEGGAVHRAAGNTPPGRDLSGGVPAVIGELRD